MAQHPLNNSFSLAQLLFVPVEPGRAVARRGVTPIPYREFATRLASVKSALEKIPSHRWLVFFDDSVEFAVALLALLSAQKQILVAPNKQAGVLLSLAAKCDAVFSDKTLPVDDANFQSKVFLISDLANTALTIVDIPTQYINPDEKIGIATSGSSGDVQLIEKPLRTFIAEMDNLERQWKDLADDACFFSTVSHQHIYGMLFRVLWPLRSGRVFHADTYAYPEPLFEDIRRVGRAVLVSSPAHLKRIPDAIKGEGLSQHLSAVFSSGGPLAHNDALEFFTRFGLTPIEVFGSTETGGVAFRQQTASDKDVPWTVFADVSFEVNGDGCLQVKSPFAYTTGKFLMGDKITRIDDKHFYHHGRADRIVKLEEKRLSLTAMENQLNIHPQVSESRVIVLEEGKRQQLGAVVVLKRAVPTLDDKRMMNEQLKNHLLPFFERSLLPRKWRYVDALPCNSQGKVTVSELKLLFNKTVSDKKEAMNGLPDAMEILEKTEAALQASLDMQKAPIFFEGHFPELAILPGVTQLHWAILLAKHHWFPDGVFLNASRIKFQKPIQPFHHIEIKLEHRGEGVFYYHYSCKDHVMSSGVFGIKTNASC